MYACAESTETVALLIITNILEWGVGSGEMGPGNRFNTNYWQNTNIDA